MGLIGKLKDKVFGVAKAEEKKEAKTASVMRTDGKHATKGAFGGTGTGRGRRGMPGRKLIKKTVKSGWSAQNRVVLSTKPVGIIGGHS